MPKHPELADKNVPNLHAALGVKLGAGGGAFPLVVRANFKAESGLPAAACGLKGP